MDRESSRGIGMRLLAPRQNNRNLIFWLPCTVASAKAADGFFYPGKSTAVRRSCFFPHSTDIDYKLLHTHTHTHTHIYKDMHSPPLPRSLASVALNRHPDKRV